MKSDGLVDERLVAQSVIQLAASVKKVQFKYEGSGMAGGEKESGE